MGVREKPVSLLVLSGLHEGASQPVEGSRVRIGSGAESDLMLADKGLAPMHLEVEAGAGFANLKALHGGVTIEGFGALGPGQQRQVPLPAMFEVAGVRLCCDGAPPSRRLQVPSKALLATLTLGLMTFVPVPARRLEVASAAAGPAGIAAGRRPGPAGQQPADSGTPAPSSPAQPTAVQGVARAAPVHPMDTEAAAALLRELAAAAKLEEIKVVAVGSVVAATGAIPPGALGRWQSVREAFDRRTGGRVQLSNGVQAHTEQPFKLALDSVWTGNFPNIVVSGAKYLEGGVLPNGWTLDRIERGRLLLRRGDDHIEVAF